MKTLILTALLSLVTQLTEKYEGRDSRMRVVDYITSYGDYAIEMEANFGSPASITLAQAILETGAGVSKVAKGANNHFGIKAYSNWTCETYGKWRAYPTVYDSYVDHSLFLQEHCPYMFKHKGWESWCNALQRSGYATSKEYEQKLKYLIRTYHLYKLDKL